MRIGVIADTHNRPPDHLLDRLKGVDELWHLGDVCNPATLEPLYSLGVPLKVVRGNNDFNPDWPITLNLKRGDLQFHLVHIPTDHPPPGVQILLHGHTHVPRDENEGEGPFSQSRLGRFGQQGSSSEFCFLTLDGKGGLEWRVELVSS